MPGCGPNVTNRQRLWRRSGQYSAVFPTQNPSALQSATIGHPRRIAGRRLHRRAERRPIRLLLRIIRSAMVSFAIHL